MVSYDIHWFSRNKLKPADKFCYGRLVIRYAWWEIIFPTRKKWFLTRSGWAQIQKVETFFASKGLVTNATE